MNVAGEHPVGRVVRRASLLVSEAERALYRAGLLTRARRGFPRFLGIGAQKAGTTWLYENLRAHPQLYLPEPKEVHYFDWHWYRSVGWYARHFEDAGDRLPGEITPGYGLIREDRIRFIRAMQPDLRIVFMMRDPVERAWSQIRMNLVRRQGRSLADIGLEQIIAEVDADRTLRRGLYTAILDRWQAHFPAEQMLVAFYEELRQAPRDLLERVFRHLGVSTDVEWDRLPVEQVIFAGDSGDMPPEVHAVLASRYAAELVELRARFGERVGHWGSTS